MMRLCLFSGQGSCRAMAGLAQALVGGSTLAVSAIGLKGLAGLMIIRTAHIV